MYLDLSFSNFLDMNHLMELHHLKSLLLGGVRVNDFSFLKYFDKLEVLSVRNCLGFHDLKDINTMSTLRSLDIGHCQKICTILDIKQLTRLEELILDSTGITSARHVPDVLDVIKDFKLLRLLNVGNTILRMRLQLRRHLSRKRPLDKLFSVERASGENKADRNIFIDA